MTELVKSKEYILPSDAISSEIDSVVDGKPIVSTGDKRGVEAALIQAGADPAQVQKALKGQLGILLTDPKARQALAAYIEDAETTRRLVVGTMLKKLVEGSTDEQFEAYKLLSKLPELGMQIPKGPQVAVPIQVNQESHYHEASKPPVIPEWQENKGDGETILEGETA